MSDSAISKAPDTPDTRHRLLDAAERLFAVHGFDAASLRAITAEAGANLAAVHYHFGSKDGLVREVFARRLAPLNQRRLELLDEVLEATPEDRPPPVEDLVRAFAGPVVTMGCAGAAPETAQFPRLLFRAFGEPRGRARDIVVDEFREVKERFVAAFGRALPHLSGPDLHWRFFFMVGTMAHTVSHGHLLPHFLGAPAGDDAEERLDRLVSFLAGGWAADPVSDPDADRPRTDRDPETPR